MSWCVSLLPWMSLDIRRKILREVFRPQEVHLSRPGDVGMRVTVVHGLEA